MYEPTAVNVSCSLPNAIPAILDSQYSYTLQGVGGEAPESRLEAVRQRITRLAGASSWKLNREVGQV